MGRSRETISITVEHGPKELGSQMRAIYHLTVTPTEWENPQRGPIRLRIDMPATLPFGFSHSLAILGGMIAICVAVAYYLEGSGFALLLGILMLASFMAAMLLIKPLAAREVFEIDSRFVTITRKRSVTGIWGRVQFTNVRLIDTDDPTAGRAGAPTFIWGEPYPGTEQSYLAGAGAGISREAAASLIAEIDSFCKEHPADPSFDYRGSGTAFG